MNTAWCPVCGNAILNTNTVPMKCAGTVPHLSEYNVYGVPQQVFPEATAPVIVVEEKQESQPPKATKANGK